MVHFGRTLRIVVAIAAGLLAALPAASPQHLGVVTGQPACDDPAYISPGRWSGTFTSRIERRWTDITASGSVRFEGSTEVTGAIDLIVPEDSGQPVVGAARATWRARTLGVSDTGRETETFASGWLTGGSVEVAERDVSIGSRLSWGDAWWSAAPGQLFSMSLMIRESGRPTVNGDGFVVPRPAGTATFVVETVGCATISGQIANATLWYPGGGRGPDAETISDTSSFRLQRQ